MSDRVLVFAHGEPVAHLTRDEVSESAILHARAEATPRYGIAAAMNGESSMSHNSPTGSSAATADQIPSALPPAASSPP